MRKVLTVLLCSMAFGLAEANRAGLEFGRFAENGSLDAVVLPDPTPMVGEPVFAYAKAPLVRTVQQKFKKRGYDLSYRSAKKLTDAYFASAKEPLAFEEAIRTLRVDRSLTAVFAKFLPDHLTWDEQNDFAKTAREVLGAIDVPMAARVR